MIPMFVITQTSNLFHESESLVQIYAVNTNKNFYKHYAYL